MGRIIFSIIVLLSLSVQVLAEDLTDKDSVGDITGEDLLYRLQDPGVTPLDRKDTVTERQTFFFTNPTLYGKLLGNGSAVNDDDCTGEQGKMWYDTTDSTFEFCNANSGAPDSLAASAGDVTAVGPGCATGACFNDGVATTGTSFIVWEGTTVDTNEYTVILPEDPGADVNITMPTSTGTLLLTDGDGSSLTGVTVSSLTGTVTWGGTSILESGAAFQFGDATDATLTHTYGNTGTNVDIVYSTGAMAVTGNLTATNLSGSNTGDDTNAITITTVDDEATAEELEVTFASQAPAATTSIKSDSGFTYNPSTGVLTAAGFAGPLTGAVTGNADTVTGATFTTALTVDTGTVTLTGNVANNSVLTIGAGAVSVSGSNTGDNTLAATITTSDDESTNTNFEIPFTGAPGNNTLYSDSGFTYNPFSNAITVGTVVADLTGNADTVSTFADNGEVLTLNTGALTLTPNADDSSVLTIGAGAVSVSGSNTGDNTVATAAASQVITDNAIATVDDADAADNDYAKFTADGLEGRSYAEVKTDLSLDNVQNCPNETPALVSASTYNVGDRDSCECYGGVLYATTATTVLACDGLADTMNFTVITNVAATVDVDPQSDDKIWLDGTVADDGDKARSTGTAGEIIVWGYYSADGWYAASDGWSEAGTTGE